MTIFFSPSSFGFYDDSMKNDYEEAGTWPQDAVEISEVRYRELLNFQSQGYVIVLGENGKPVLTPPPSLTSEDAIKQAETTKSKLMGAATTAIAPLQDAVDLGIATAEEVEKLTEWKQYRVNLNRVDTTTAPEIEWPDVPA